VIAVSIYRRYFQKFETCRNYEEFITALCVVILPYILFTRHELSELLTKIFAPHRITGFLQVYK